MRVYISSLDQSIEKDRLDQDTKTMTPIRLQNKIRDKVLKMANIESRPSESEVLRALIRMGIEAFEKNKGGASE